MGHTKEVQIVLIPVWERVSLQFLSCVFGVWVLFKRLAKWVWNPSAFAQITRDKPPSCLVDTSLGQHKYVKLKVSMRRPNFEFPPGIRNLFDWLIAVERHCEVNIETCNNLQTSKANLRVCVVELSRAMLILLAASALHKSPARRFN